jgi:hypothetical protein
MPPGPERTGRNCLGSRHRVSANASETKPAKILAIFVVDDQGKMLGYPIKSECTRRSTIGVKSPIEGARFGDTAGIVRTNDHSL